MCALKFFFIIKGPLKPSENIMNIYFHGGTIEQFWVKNASFYLIFLCIFWHFFEFFFCPKPQIKNPQPYGLGVWYPTTKRIYAVRIREITSLFLHWSRQWNTDFNNDMPQRDSVMANECSCKKLRSYLLPCFVYPTNTKQGQIYYPYQEKGIV